MKVSKTRKDLRASILDFVLTREEPPLTRDVRREFFLSDYNTKCLLNDLEESGKIRGVRGGPDGTLWVPSVQ